MNHINKSDFIDFTTGLLTYIITKEVQREIHIQEMIEKIFRHDDNVYWRDLDKIPWSSQQCSFLKRIELLNLIRHAYGHSNDNIKSKLDSKHLIELIVSSLLGLCPGEIHASVGSQGFLSIPLYRKQFDDEHIEILRLHIWSEELKPYINQENVENYAIHSHVLHAHSWVLLGEIINTEYSINETSYQTGTNFFKIEWETSKKDSSDNNKKSRLINTGKMADISHTKTQIISSGNSYMIDAGVFHKSRVNPSSKITATLFFFSSKLSLVKNSYLLGPSGIIRPAENLYTLIPVKNFLDKLLILSDG